MGELATRRSQTERAETTKKKLMDAAMSSLVDLGYARTTAVEVCRRAAVTRGALFHHYESLPQLLGDAMEARFGELLAPLSQPSAETINLAQWLQGFWDEISAASFKAVIEIWFAARNDPVATSEIQPAINRIGAQFDPMNNPQLAPLFQADPLIKPFYHTAVEAMFGLLLGRATSPDHKPLDHEDVVLGFLFDQAKAFTNS